MPPQITCPHCGSTINLENRKEVDFEKIMYALDKSPRTFTELLTITNLPRKTLSIRLKELCTSGSIVKDGGYHLNSSIKPTGKILRKRNGNGKMNGTMLHIGKNVQWIPAALIVCLVVVAFGSAVMLSAPPVSNTPNANFFFSPSSGIFVGRAVTFGASASDADGDIVSYFWDLGDGSTGSGTGISHTYASTGVYLVSLTVTDSQSNHVTITKTIAVSLAPQSTTKIMFTVAPDPAGDWESKWIAGKPLTFDASEFNDANGYIPNYAWNFGDETTESGTPVSHVYQQAGTYNVALTVTDKANTIHTVIQQVTILAMPTTTMYVDMPAQYQVGDIITMNIMISNVTDLFAWQSGMTFNPAVLECVTTTYTDPENATRVAAFTQGEFLQRGGDTLWIGAPVDNGIIIAHGNSLYSFGTPVSGSGTLATATFKVIGEGALNIHLTNVILLAPDGVTEIPVYVAT
jgi:PKD repeat protein